MQLPETRRSLRRQSQIRSTSSSPAFYRAGQAVTCDVASHASPVQPVQAPVHESRDYPRYPYGSIDLRESVQESLSIDANAHMRKEAQPVRPNDSQQSFDEPISSKAVSKEAGGEEKSDESVYSSWSPIPTPTGMSRIEVNAVGESADGDEKEEDYGRFWEKDLDEGGVRQGQAQPDEDLFGGRSKKDLEDLFDETEEELEEEQRADQWPDQRHPPSCRVHR